MQTQITGAGTSRLGLARSRHDTEDAADQQASKKGKTGHRSFAHDQRVADGSGGYECKHCQESVSPNITRCKRHLIKCQVFLGSADAKAAAAGGGRRGALIACVPRGAAARPACTLVAPGSLCGAQMKVLWPQAIGLVW
jgi:hypothetical protein